MDIDLLTSLQLSLLAVTEDRHQWVKFSRHHGKRGCDLYYWCHKGWAANNFEGYGWGVSNALREYVPDGDLTAWWSAGRSRKDVLSLFTAAIEEMCENLLTQTS